MRYSPGVWSLLVGTVLMNGGFFMLYPLLALHLTRDLGFDATTAGLILAVRILVQQGTSPLGGAFSDRVGYKPLIVAGYSIRVLAFAAFAIPGGLVGVILGVVLTVVGGALFDAPSRAVLAVLVPERERQGVFAAISTAGWIGQIVGPLVGSVLLPFGFFWIGLVSASAFLVCTLQSLVLLPGGLKGEATSISVWSSIGIALRDREFSRFVVLLLGYYFLVVQMVATVPLLTARLVTAEAVGVIYAAQAGVGLIFQVPLTRWLATRMQPLSQVVLGQALLGASFIGYALAGDLVTLAASTAIFALGTVMVNPVQATLTAQLAGGQAGAYFGVGALALAVGGAGGNFLGGVFLDAGTRAGLPWLPWAGMAGIGFASAIGFVWLSRDTRVQARLALHHRPRYAAA